MSTLLWRVLAGVFTLAASSGVALWIYKKQSNKALTYHVVSTSPLVPLQARGFADLRLQKGDKPIERPVLATIRFSNSGDVEIRTGDFEAPLAIRPIGFGLVAMKPDLLKGFTAINIPYKGVASFVPQVVDARIAVTSPPKIPVELVVQGDQLLIKPLLLNPKDEFTIDVLVNGDVRGIEVGGRIAGIKEILEETEGASLWSGNTKLGHQLLGWSFVSLILTFVFALAGSVRLQRKSESGYGPERRIPKWLVDFLVGISGLATIGLAFTGILLKKGGPTEVALALALLIAVFGAAVIWLRARD